MKKFWLFATLWLATLALAGCNCNCDKATNEDEVLKIKIAARQRAERDHTWMKRFEKILIYIHKKRKFAIF